MGPVTPIPAKCTRPLPLLVLLLPPLPSWYCAPLPPLLSLLDAHASNSGTPSSLRTTEARRREGGAHLRLVSCSVRIDYGSSFLSPALHQARRIPRSTTVATGAAAPTLSTAALAIRVLLSRMTIFVEHFDKIRHRTSQIFRWYLLPGS